MTFFSHHTEPDPKTCQWEGKTLCQKEASEKKPLTSYHMQLNIKQRTWELNMSPCLQIRLQ